MKELPIKLTPTEQTLGFFYWGFQMMALPATMSILLAFFELGLSEAQEYFLFCALCFLCTTVIFFRFLAHSGKQAIAQPFRVLQSAFYSYASYWISFLAIRWLITKIQPGFANVNDASITQLVQKEFTLIAMATVLLVPVAEELLYRGLIFGTLHGHSRFWAYAISCAAFAAIHVVGYVGQYDFFTLLLCYVQYIAPGICLCWAYERSGNIFAPILMHIAVNQTTILTLR